MSVSFDLRCRRDGKLVFSFKDLPFSASTCWLTKAFASEGRYAQFLELTAEDPTGNQYHTDYFLLSSLRENFTPDAVALTPHGTTDWLEVRHPIPAGAASSEPTAGHSVRYCLVGMQGFGILTAQSELGTISLSANSQVDDYTLVTGVLEINTSEKLPSLEAWLTACDSRADMVLEILSLALDHRVVWTARHAVSSGSPSATLFVGPRPGALPQQPLFSHLHLQPAFDLAVTAYTDKLRDEMGLGPAIEWFLMRHRFAEVNFLTAMTALEHILNCFASTHSAGGVVPSSVFAPVIAGVRSALKTGLAAAGLQDAVTAKLLCDRAGDINRPPLKDLLRKFLATYRVPLDGISEEDVSAVIRARNDIVHGHKVRRMPGAEQLFDHLVVLREILVRIFLTLLGYAGDRWSYLRGPQDEKFPPAASGTAATRGSATTA